ncbi:hypothetical protein BH09VER1_BH09VER1_10530 [soil metagenome]
MSDTALPESLDAIERVMKNRRATRHFSPREIDRELLVRLLEAARWAPSGYNLQPTRFIIVQDSSLKPALRRACLNQSQVEEAPAVVIFAGDHRAFEDHFENAIGLDLQAGSINDEYATLLRRVVPIMFQRGPLGFHWLWKVFVLPVARLFTPLPIVPAVHKSFWLAKQAMLCAMNFMLAAEAAGLATVPMEGFDTGRLKRCLNLPASWEPLLVVPVGYPLSSPATKTRLPLDQLTLWR